MEIVIYWVIAAEVRRGANPQFTTTIHHHGHHPVVMQPSPYLVFITHGEVTYRLGLDIIGGKALGVSRNKHPTLAVVSHQVDVVTFQRKHFGIGTRQGIIAIDAIVGTNPVGPLSVTIDRIGLRRGSRMGYHFAVFIEAIDTIILNSTPRDASITQTERSHRTADTHILCRETPRTELRLLLRQQKQTTFQTAYPKVILIVGIECPYVGSLQVE